MKGSQQGHDADLRQWERHIHAFATLCTDEAPEHGLLAGMRVGVKDIIDVAGVPTQNGSDACKDAKPALQDASAVAALRSAGAHIVGKTTTTEFAFTDPTACRNPYDLRRSPGGSSSGSGAAVAAGVVDIALGTQTAGSLCRPAAYCGVVGFKPTYGVLPTQGVTPLATNFDTVGIIAGSVGLAQKAFTVFAGAHDTKETPLHTKALCGLWQTEAVPDGDLLAGMQAAKNAFGGLGTDVAEGPLNADVGPIVTAHRTVMNHEAHIAHGGMLADGRANLLKPKFLAGLQAGAAISPDAVAQAREFLTKAKKEFWAGLLDIDTILTLPVPEGAPMMDGTTGFQDWLTPWTVFGGPLVCLPWGMDSLRRPMSVMLAARPGNDHSLLEAAARLEAVSPDLPRPVLPNN